MCAGWTWYLANDFQFFCLSPVFLVLLVTIPPLSWVILASTAVASWIATVVMIDNKAVDQNGLDMSRNFDVLYDKPWTRISPYLVGQ